MTRVSINSSQKSILKFLTGILISLFTITSSYGQGLSGVITDFNTGETLPEVFVIYNSFLNLGTTTDFDGRFEIEDISDVDGLTIQYIGYEKLQLKLEDLDIKKDISIQLKTETSVLSEVNVMAGENPSLRIVRKAIQAKAQNDPHKKDSYLCKIYSKNVLNERQDSLMTANRLHHELKNKSNSLNLKQLLVAESVSEKKYRRPDKKSEKIIGARLSGFKHTIYAFASDDVQKFGLYDEVIKVLSERYITPLANGSDKRYFYILKDTLVSHGDTTFVMDYHPNLGSNFEGLKGEIRINSNGWAMEYVSAEPVFKGKVDFYLEQEYAPTPSGDWFPKALVMTMSMEKIPFLKKPGFITSKVFVDSVQINLPLGDHEFDSFQRQLTEKAAYVDENFWAQNRKEELSQREIRTYERVDSIGQKYKADVAMHATRNMYKGFLSFGKLEFKMNQILTYNLHEGLRLGAGVYTNELYSKKIRFGGYFGYGLKDKRFKYGGTFQYFFNRKEKEGITFKYSYDLFQPGQVNLRYYDIPDFWVHFLRQQMDFKEELSAVYHKRMTKDLHVSVGMRAFSINPNSAYVFNDYQPLLDDRKGVNRFQMSEINMSLRWAYKEKRSANMGQDISLGSDYPIVRVNYAKGINGFLNGTMNYNKLEAGVKLKRFFKGIGKLHVTMEAGLVDAAIPIPTLFSGKSGFSEKFSVISQNLFQTMRYNEFFSDQYVSLFINHNLGSLIFRTERFAPEFRLYHAMSFGKLSNKSAHQNIDFKTLEAGFMESGLAANNIVKINCFDVGYIGVGAGVFYRYGGNQLANKRDNTALKLALTYSIN